VTEHFAVKQGVGQAAAVDGHEVALSVRAGLVQAARHQLFAGAGLALDEHIGRAAGQAGQPLAQALHAGRLAQQLALDGVALRQLAPQFTHLQHQTALFKGTAHGTHQVLGGKGLLDEVVGAVFHGLHRHRDVAMASDQHHRQFRVQGHQLAHESEPVAARQPDVADHDACKVGSQALARRLGTAYAVAGNAFELQRLLAAQHDVGVVFDDQDFEGFSHGLGGVCRVAHRGLLAAPA